MNQASRAPIVMLIGFNSFFLEAAAATFDNGPYPTYDECQYAGSLRKGNIHGISATWRKDEWRCGESFVIVPAVYPPQPIPMMLHIYRLKTMRNGMFGSWNSCSVAGSKYSTQLNNFYFRDQTLTWTRYQCFPQKTGKTLLVSYNVSLSDRPLYAAPPKRED